MNLRELISSLPFEFERTVCLTLNKALGRRPSSEPFISGDTFRARANIKFDSEKDFLCPKIKNGDVVFVHTGMLNRFITEVLPAVTELFTLVTHQSDIIIDETYRAVADNPHIGMWFCENCILEHEKVVPLPIGLENQYYHNSGNVSSIKKWQRRVNRSLKHDIPRGVKHNSKNGINNDAQNGTHRRAKNTDAKNARFKEPTVLIALNFATNPDARFACYRAFHQKPIAKELASFVSADVYRKHVAHSMFIASPSGNGLDCHRTWEALYLKTVPLVEDNYMNRSFAARGLPIIIVKDWEAFAQKSATELTALYKETMQNAKWDGAYADFWLKEMRKNQNG